MSHLGSSCAQNVLDVPCLAGATKDEPGQVVEVYRVRLPTQKEDKRGVVRISFKYDHCKSWSL